MSIPNQVQLITYPDSLGGDLKSLRAVLQGGPLAGLFAGVHILPPFPSSGDRGFAPRTYFEIEPRFGTWDDIRRIGEQHDVLVDLMVNHISRQSPYFQDFQKNGRRSEYADLFITLDKVWPGGNPAAQDVAKIFLRRPEHPFADIAVEETGETERVWATFGTRDWSEQIDLDVHAPVTRSLFKKILAHMSRQGVKILRLDAIAFVIKKPGTSCFFIEPEIYDFMEWMQAEAGAVGIELLPEVHANYAIQLQLAEHGFWAYNFVLPLVILHGFVRHSSRVLREHLRVCPRKQVTMLDCHDGIPVQPDLDEILDIDEAQAVVRACLERGANLNRILSEQHKRRADFDAHQINITYYAALECSDDAYIAARAVQFFAPGIPQVYYVGLLAGENDQAGVAQSGEGRAINRRNYTVQEIEESMAKPVVQRLAQLIRFRNEYEAFNGDFEVLETEDCHLVLTWRKEAWQCTLCIDFEASRAAIEYRGPDGQMVQYIP